MPPTEKKVPPAQIAVIERWIAAGRPDAPRRAREPAAGHRHHARGARLLGLPADPPRRAADVRRRPTASARRSTPSCWRSCADRGLSFAPDADRLTLLRRASLRPDRPAADARASRRIPLAISRTDAYERMIDRLLDSPHYGERWGAALARRRRLRRLRRRRHQRHAAALRLQVSRLRHPLPQRRQAARSLHRRATGRRRAGRRARGPT